MNERWGVLRENEPFSSIEEQIVLLKKRNLTIRDEDRAYHALSVIGYHRLRDYFRPFYKNPDAPSSDRKFANSTSFNTILSLYYLDRELRFFLLGPLEKLEVSLRGRLIDHIGNYSRSRLNGSSSSFNLLDPTFYNLSNQDNRDDYQRLVGAIFQSVNMLASPEQKKQISQLKEIKPKIPPHEMIDWVAPWPVIHKLSFGPLAQMFRILKPEVSKGIAQEFDLKTPVLRRILDSLRIVRNSCAHHEPIWFRHFQHIPLPKSISSSVWPRDLPIETLQNASGSARVYEICVILHFLMAKVSENTTWYKRLCQFVERFDKPALEFMGFPPDWSDLEFWRNPAPGDK